MAGHRSSRARRPIDDCSSCENKRHADFSFAIWKEIRNPPRRVNLPIDKRRMSGCVISVKPERRPSQGDHPSCDCLFAHNKTQFRCDLPVTDCREPRHSHIYSESHPPIYSGRSRRAELTQKRTRLTRAKDQSIRRTLEVVGVESIDAERAGRAPAAGTPSKKGWDGGSGKPLTDLTEGWNAVPCVHPVPGLNMQNGRKSGRGCCTAYGLQRG